MTLSLMCGENLPGVWQQIGSDCKGRCIFVQALLPVWFNRFTGKYNRGNTYTVGGLADSYYEYLLKLWILRGRRVGELIKSPNYRQYSGWL